MAAICDMAIGRLADHRYFLESIHDRIKTDFMRNKLASSYILVTTKGFMSEVISWSASTWQMSGRPTVAVTDQLN